MPTYASPDDLCNAVISELGYERRIGELNEGSPASKAFLDLYGQARDELLIAGMGSAAASRVTPWPFSVARKLLTGPIKSATEAYPGAWNSATMPPPPWQYEWSLPGDFLRALNVTVVPPAPGIVYNPTPLRWTLTDDNQYNADGSSALLTMASAPIFVYIAQVLSPTMWDTAYTANLIANLKRKAVLALKKDPQLLGLEAQLEEKTQRSSAAVQP